MALNGIRRRYTSAALLGICVAGSIAAAQTSVMVESPPGWFGVTLSDTGVFDERGTAFFEGYPVVSAVEPGSPAAKAGVMPGDVLMSFNSRDMRGNAVQVRSWLKPGAPFVLQLRRNDAVRIVRGTLGRAPEGWEAKLSIDIRQSPTEAFVRKSGAPSRQPPQRVSIRRTPMPSRVPSALIPAFTFGAGVYPFAGMEFTALNEDIQEVLGVGPEGVFVTNVVEGSPARISGLRGGDVLLLANGMRLNTPVDLVQVIAEAQERTQTLSLRIVRKRKQQNLTLRW